MSCECVFRDDRISSVASIERYEFFRRPSIRSKEGVRDENQHLAESNGIESFKESNVYQRLRNEPKKNGTLSRRSFSFLKKMFKRKTENLNERVSKCAENDEVNKFKCHFVYELI